MRPRERSSRRDVAPALPPRRVAAANLIAPAVLVLCWTASPALAQALGASTPAAPATASHPSGHSTPPSRPTVSFGADGLKAASEDGSFELRLRAYLQVDGRAYVSSPPPLTQSSFVIKRARPVFEATAYRRFSFRLMPDFGEGKVVIYDAYVDMRLTDQVSLRTGKFKSPFGLERLQSATDLRFVERAFPTVLAPNRDIGVMVQGAHAGGGLSWAAALGNGVPDGSSADLDEQKGKGLVGRVFAPDLGRLGLGAAKGLGIGVAAEIQDREGTVLSPGLAAPKTSGQQPVFRFRLASNGLGPVLADGRHWRLSPQATYYRGPVGLMFEWVRSSQDVALDAQRARVAATAWQVTGSWFVTGEPAGYRTSAPTHPLDPHAGHWGALEVGLRVHALRLDAEAFPTFVSPDVSARAADAWGLMATWHLQRGVKLVTTYEETRFDGGAPSGDRATERLVLVRTQLAF